jgi:hypothetical protein
MRKLTVKDMPEGYKFAAVDSDGIAYAYKSAPAFELNEGYWDIKDRKYYLHRIGSGFDSTNWENSLIKIDSYEDHAALGVMAHKFQSLHKAPTAEPTAAKDQASKPSFAEVDPEFLLAMAERMTANKGKYEPFNWQKPCDINLLLDAAQRHLLALRMPEQEGTEETHLDHAVALSLNAMIIHYQLLHNERTP